MINRKYYIIGLVLSAVLCITCIIIAGTFSRISKSILISRTDLTPNKNIFNQWIQPHLITSVEVYFFNLTNPREFLNGSKPVLSQIGPYTYNLYEQKQHVSYNANLGEISFELKREFHFASSLSCHDCTEFDTITQVNLALVNVANNYFQDLNTTKQLATLFELGSEGLIKQIKVIDLVWGYDDPILKMFANNSHITGLFSERTARPKMVVSDGLKNSHFRGKMLRYMDQPSMDVWTSKYANLIYGTDGTLFHPMIEKNEDLHVFMPDLCLSTTFQFKFQFNLDGLTVYRYNLARTTFQSGINFEWNKGFCLDYPNCYKDGLLDMSTCTEFYPVVLSQPHFYQADETYRQSVLGLYPTSEVESTFVIEPKTGSVLESDEKFQVNLVVIQNSHFRDLKHIQSVILPLMHFNKTFIAPHQFRKQLMQDVYNTPHTIRTMLIWLSICSLSVFFIIGLFYYKHYVKKEQKGYAETKDKVETQSIVKM